MFIFFTFQCVLHINICNLYLVHNVIDNTSLCMPLPTIRISTVQRLIFFPFQQVGTIWWYPALVWTSEGHYRALREEYCQLTAAPHNLSSLLHKGDWLSVATASMYSGGKTSPSDLEACQYCKDNIDILDFKITIVCVFF